MIVRRQVQPFHPKRSENDRRKATVHFTANQHLKKLRTSQAFIVTALAVSACSDSGDEAKSEDSGVYQDATPTGGDEEKSHALTCREPPSVEHVICRPA